jgi:transposase
MNTLHRGDLSEAQWARLQPLLPPQKAPVGKPAHDHRRILNGILWKLRTGAPWRDLPERYGPWSTVACRFRRWRRAGVWDRLLAAVQQAEDAAGHVDWTLQFVDGTIIRAHQHAAGAKGGGPQARPWAAAKGASAPRSTSSAKAAARG